MGWPRWPLPSLDRREHRIVGLVEKRFLGIVKTCSPVVHIHVLVSLCIKDTVNCRDPLCGGDQSPDLSLHVIIRGRAIAVRADDGRVSGGNELEDPVSLVEEEDNLIVHGQEAFAGPRRVVVE
jgi:hypothetical protein